MYTKIVVTKHSKYPNVYRATAFHKKDGWEGQNDFINLVEVKGGIVIMRLQQPIQVCQTLKECCKVLSLEFRCVVTVII